MKRIATLCMVGVAVAALSIASFPAMGRAQATTTRIISNLTFIPSGQAVLDITACVGEEIVFDGERLLVMQGIVSDDGTTTTWVLHFNLKRVVATGEDTGVTYRVNGHIQAVSVSGPAESQFNYSSSVTLNLLSPGDGPKFLAVMVFHVTVDAEGAATAVVDIVDVDCQNGPSKP